MPASHPSGDGRTMLAPTRSAKAYAKTPESLLTYYRGELVMRRPDAGVVTEFLSYLKSTGPWTGSDAQVQTKAAGLVHLIAGSPEYQFA